MREAAISVLAVASAYLITLGTIALLDRRLAFGFLQKFAQTIGANILEMTCRMAAGLAFIQLAPELPAPRLFQALGWILSGSAILLLALPGFHRRFANIVVPAVERTLPVMGLVSLAAGVGLAVALIPLILGPSSPY